MSRELEGEALFYESERAKNRTMGCFSGCATFFVPIFFLTSGYAPVVMFLTFGLGIFFMIRGLSARAKRDEAYRKLGALKTHNGYVVPSSEGAPSTSTVVTGPIVIPPVPGLPPTAAVDPRSLATSSAAGTTAGSNTSNGGALDASQDGAFADDDKLAERLKKAKKSGF